MRKVLLAAVLSLGIGLSVPAAVQAEQHASATDIIMKMFDRDNEFSDRTDEIQITIVRGDDVKVRRLTHYIKHYGREGVLEKNMLVFHQPAKYRFDKILSYRYNDSDQADETWMYQHRNNVLIRVSALRRYASFVDSDFSIEDMDSPDEVHDFTYEMIGKENFDGKLCYVIERKPVKGRKSNYSRSVDYVDCKELVRLKTDCYDRKGKLDKTIYYEKYDTFRGNKVCMLMWVEQSDKSSTTILERERVRYNSDLSDRIFSQSYLKR